jgi:hypothetical protein
MTFTTAVYPRLSLEAAVLAFAHLCPCRIVSSTDDCAVVDFDDLGTSTLISEFANYALDHAVTLIL